MTGRISETKGSVRESEMWKSACALFKSIQVLTKNVWRFNWSLPGYLQR